MRTLTQARPSVKTERKPQHRWLPAWIPFDGRLTLTELRYGLTRLEITSDGKRPVCQVYRVQTYQHERTRKLEGITLTKCDECCQPTDTVYTIDCSFGPAPEHWFCDCFDMKYARPVKGCKHIQATANALCEAGLLEDLVRGRAVESEIAAYSGGFDDL